MPEYRHVRSGSLNIPSGSAAGSPMMPRSPPSASLHAPARVPVLPSGAALTAARPHLVMPPRLPYREGENVARRIRNTADGRPAVDTSHVPCKFFRQGTCQAGSACPFSHDLGASAETVCKYFAKVRPSAHPQHPSRSPQRSR